MKWCSASSQSRRKPVFLSMIDGTADGSGAPRVLALQREHFAEGNEGPLLSASPRRKPHNRVQANRQSYNVADPSSYRGYAYHYCDRTLRIPRRNSRECDTGIAYVIAGAKADGWRQGQHVYICSNLRRSPRSRWASVSQELPGGQPSSSSSWTSCTRRPGGELLQRSIQSARRGSSVLFDFDGRSRCGRLSREAL